MKVIAATLVIIATASLVLATESDLPPADVLLREIDGRGARFVLGELWRDEPLFDALCARIATGDPQWLLVADRLRPVSDAAASFSLDFSVALALPSAPIQVLQLLDSSFSLPGICIVPAHENTPERVVAERRARALSALSGVSVPNLRPRAEECAARIRAVGP
jgi:hypothetical protein